MLYIGKWRKQVEWKGREGKMKRASRMKRKRRYEMDCVAHIDVFLICRTLFFNLKIHVTQPCPTWFINFLKIKLAHVVFLNCKHMCFYVLMIQIPHFKPKSITTNSNRTYRKTSNTHAHTDIYFLTSYHYLFRMFRETVTMN